MLYGVEMGIQEMVRLLKEFMHICYNTLVKNTVEHEYQYSVYYWYTDNTTKS